MKVTDFHDILVPITIAQKPPLMPMLMFAAGQRLSLPLLFFGYVKRFGWMGVFIKILFTISSNLIFRSPESTHSNVQYKLITAFDDFFVVGRTFVVCR